ncbi:hypothetical protein D3C72_1500710 [compost metagenome]
MRKAGYQHQVQQLGNDQHADGDLDRRANVLAGIETRRQHLDGHHRQQTDAIALQCQGNLPDVRSLERAVVEQHRHQGLGKGQQGCSAGHCQQHHHAQSPVQHGAIACIIASRLGRSQLGCQHHAQRHAQQCRGKLHQPVGIEQPCHAARSHVRRNLRVDHQRYLRHPDTQQCWCHQRQDAAHASICPGRLDD